MSDADLRIGFDGYAIGLTCVVMAQANSFHLIISTERLTNLSTYIYHGNEIRSMVVSGPKPDVNLGLKTFAEDAADEFANQVFKARDRLRTDFPTFWKSVATKLDLKE